MGIISWIIFGALAGWIASKFTGNDGNMGAFANIIAGIVGASVGGYVFGLIGGRGVTGFNIGSLFVAVIGAVIVLAILNAIKRK